MIETTVQLICDWCEAVYPANMLDTGSVARLRIAASKDGWKALRRGRIVKDVCPECRTEAA